MCGIAGVLIFAATCQSDQKSDPREFKRESLLLSYRVGGGMGMYDDGDRYGYGIDIQSDGSYLLYRRFYQNRTGEASSIREKEVDQGELNLEEFASLKAKLDSLNLSSIPKRLPDVDPRKVEIRTPAETVILRVRSIQSEELVEIRADMGTESQHYPSAFLRLHKYLKRLIRQLLSEADE